MGEKKTIFLAQRLDTDTLFGPPRRHIEWVARTITHTVQLYLSQEGFVRVADSSDPSQTTVTLASYAHPHSRAPCFLLPPPGMPVYLNGQPAASLTALNDRDEIALSGEAGGRAYFLGEAEAKVEPYRETDEEVRCPRSNAVLRAGMPVVYCPGCEHPYLQSEEVPAYTYGAECAVCQRPARLGLSWRPAEESLAGNFDLARALDRGKENGHAKAG